MKRSGAIAVVAAAMVAVLAAVLPALAADGTVDAQGSRFYPADVAVRPGEKVTFRNSGPTRHTLKFDDERSARADGQSWIVERVFNDARETPYRFVCQVHVTVGMTGNVYVNATGTLPAQPTPTPTSGFSTPTPTATATATATATTGPGGGTGPPPATELRSLELTATRFCARRSDDCSRPGVRLTIDLSAPAEVDGTVKRRRPSGRYKRFGTVDFGVVDAGPQELAFKRVESGRRLKPGRHKLKLSAAGEKHTLKFRVTR